MLPKVHYLFDKNQKSSSEITINGKNSHSSAEETHFHTETMLYVVRRDDQATMTNTPKLEKSKRSTVNFNETPQIDQNQTPKLSTSARNLISFSNPFRRLNNLLRSEFKSNQSASSPAIHETTFSESKTKKSSLKTKRSKSINPDLNDFNESFPPPPPEFLSQESISTRPNQCCIRAHGFGLYDGFTNTNNYFDLTASITDLKNISITIDGPSKVAIQIESIHDDLYRVYYKCSFAGKYQISVMHEGEHINGSPYQLFLRDRSVQDIFSLNSNDSMRVYIEPIEFYAKKSSVVHVYPSSSCNVFQAYIQTPRRDFNLPIIVHKSTKSEVYEIYFRPKKSGYYWLNIHLNYLPVLNNPIRLTVNRSSLAKNIYDEDKISFHAYVGESSQFFVSKCPPNQSSPIGNFSVGIDGLSPISLDATETELGYEFQCKPMKSGQYKISIRNGNEHIDGSPILLRVDDHVNNFRWIDDVKSHMGAKHGGFHQGSLSNLDNSSKVCVFGDGLYEAKKGRKSSFKIDASQAGHGLLLVGLQSPIGSYERLVIKKVKSSTADFIFKVSYRVNNGGHYLLTILYGLNMQHVPGSPYSLVVD